MQLLLDEEGCRRAPLQAGMRRQLSSEQTSWIGPEVIQAVIFGEGGDTMDALHPPPSSPCIFGSLFSPRCPRRGAQVLQLVLLAFQSFQPTCWWPHLHLPAGLLVLVLCGISSRHGGLCGHTACAIPPAVCSRGRPVSSWASNECSGPTGGAEYIAQHKLRPEPQRDGSSRPPLPALTETGELPDSISYGQHLSSHPSGIRDSPIVRVLPVH